MALREILAKFGFEYDKAKLQEINKGVQGTQDLTQNVVKVLGGAALIYGVKNFISGIEQLGSSLNDLSEQTGAGTDSIQLFQFITGQSGVEAEEASAAIRKLSVSLGAASAGGQQAKAFQELKVGFRDAAGGARTLDDVLPDLFESFGQITDDGKASRLAVELFGKSGVKMLAALKQGKPGFEAFKDEFEALGGGLSAEAIAAADEYGDSLFKLNFAFTGIKSLLGAELFPILTELIGYFTDGVSILRRFMKNTELVKATLITLGIAGVAAITALLAPFAPIIAAVTMFSLLLDDLLNFIEGNDSVIGAALNGIFGEGTAGKVRGFLQDIEKEVKGFFEDLLKHPKKFIEDMTLLFNGLSSDVKKFLGISSGAQAQVESGVAVPQVVKDQAAQDTASEEDLVTTFGSKKLTKVIANDYLLNKLGIVDSKTFGRKSAGFSGPEAPPVTVEPPSVATDNKPVPVSVEMSERATAPLPVQVQTETKGEDWFGQVANTFGKWAGFENGSLPATAPVPGAAPQPNQNTVTQTITNHFAVSVDTPGEVQDAVERGVTKGIGNERRNAVNQLENKGGN